MSIPAAHLGPCEVWCDGQDVQRVCSADPGTVGPTRFDTAAWEASAALYEISGRRFPGLCSRTVRPCGEARGCWLGAPYALARAGWNWNGHYWGDEESSEMCGCSPLSTVKLAGYPVQEIVSVKIDGAVVDPSTYRLDYRRDLVRMDDPGPPVETRAWPSCQNLALADTEPGTFSVTYRWGEVVPQLGIDAAASLACELLRSFDGQTCSLPAGTTRVTREGVTVERELLTNWFDPSKATGIPAVDLFLRAYWPTRSQRQSAVWSPDVQPFARKVGT